MRSARPLAFFLLLVLSAGCGGTPATDAGGGNGGDGDTAATPTPDDGGGGGGGSAGDLGQLAEDLTPPNSTETSRTETGGVIFLTFDSTDSVDELRSFYESAIANAGLEILNTTSAEGGHAWIFGDSSGSAGGVVTVAPGADGGSTVAVQVGAGEAAGDGDGDGATPPDDGGIPSDAELEPRYDRLIAALTPPGGTEVHRESPGPLDLGVFFETNESLDSLIAFYDEAIPDAGLEIIGFDDQFPDHRTWDFQAGDEFFGGISVSPSEGGYRVLISMLGIPPAD